MDDASPTPSRLRVATRETLLPTGLHIITHTITEQVGCVNKHIICARITAFEQPVVGFAEHADISAIRSFETGMIYTSELPAFFERHAHPKFARNPSPWILAGLQKVPTWDLILTTNNERINGIIQSHELTFREADGRWYTLPYSAIHSFLLQRAGFFSAHDQMTVQYTNGSTQVFHSVGGETHLQRVGERQVHQLRNVNRIIVGWANKFPVRQSSGTSK